MIEIKRRPPGRRVRSFASGAAAIALLLFTMPAGAGTAEGLDLSVGDVFPLTRSDIGFAVDPDALILAQSTGESSPGSAWESAIPPAKDFDWVQTTSGEWLKGELKQMYSGSMEFDSDEFDIQTIDMDDVAQFRGVGEKRISIDGPDGPEVYVGKLVITKDTVVIDTADGRQEFPRSRLLAVTEGAESEWDNWSAKISLGVNFSRGNSNQTDLTAKLNVKRQTPENRFVVDYLGNMSENSNAQTVNNHRLSGFFDMFVAKEYFFRPAFGEYFRDPFQNIDQRVTVGFGAGYHIIDTPDTTWDVFGGPGYRWTRYVSVSPGESDEVDTPALVAGTYYDTSFTDDIDFNASYDFSIVNDESGRYTHHIITTVEIELTEILDFDISFVWDRTQKPQTRSDGTTPDKDDFQLLFTLGVDI